MGIAPSDFLNMTPFELSLCADEYNNNRVMEQEDKLYAAYITARLTASFVWAKRIPEYKECFKSSESEKPSSNEEIINEFKKINAAFGGNIY